MRLLCFVFLAALSCLAPARAIEWQALFIAGDDSIENFDNGRRDLTALLAGIGDVTDIQVTSSRRVARNEEITLADDDGLAAAFTDWRASKGQGCVIHMTSHGTQEGLYLARSSVLDPYTLAELVDDSCDKYPTVILVSACYSGVFLADALKGPNRIIMTAARDDRPSFGCSSEDYYTYWDACLLDTIEKGKLWRKVYAEVQSCIRRKEGQVGADPSEPQAFFGENTANWTVLF